MVEKKTNRSILPCKIRSSILMPMMTSNNLIFLYHANVHYRAHFGAHNFLVLLSVYINIWLIRSSELK